jgi:hypothetical protein
MLPDGRILSTGDQGAGASDEGHTFETFIPPALFTTDGLGYRERPAILTNSSTYPFPNLVAYGQTFDIVVTECQGSTTLSYTPPS